MHGAAERHTEVGHPTPTPTTVDTGPRPTSPKETVVEERAAPQIDRRRARSRRVLNVGIAVVGLIITSPLFILIAILVRLSSPGPIFYRQLRVGLDRRRAEEDPTGGRRNVDYGGRLFRIWKFRTMQVDADRAGEVWASREDPRVTRVGRLLRKHRLDELPQLFNVLAGDMNIVGPRPEQPNIFMELRDRIAGFPYRQRVLPGITGWAQINHHYGDSLDDAQRKVDLDLEYLERQSVLEDLKIMWQTVPVMLFREGGW